MGDDAVALMSEALRRIFARCEKCGASDVHLACGLAPRFRLQGSLLPAPGFDALDSAAVDAIAMELGLETLPVGCPDGTERIRTTLVKDGSIDGAIASPSGARYRFNLFRESGRTAVALRRLDSGFRSLEELGLPAGLAGFTGCRDGLVIVTGPTGSGKSTTLATLIDTINSSRAGHIITIEDPIEFVHASKMCLVNQRQVGRDAKSFNDALVEAMRQDPDVILVGEIRDLATFRTALLASETGHLVFATLHAGDCAGAVERFVGVFPADEQSAVRRQLSLVLRGIFAQHLVKAKTGGRVAACELMLNSVALANLIATGRTAQIYGFIENGARAGMITLDQSLAALVERGIVDEATALTLTRNPEAFRARLHFGPGCRN